MTRSASKSFPLLTALAVSSLTAVSAPALAEKNDPQRNLRTPAEGAPQVYRGAQSWGPFEATVFNGDLRKLPKVRAWRPGDAIKEIPRRHHRDDLPSDDVQPANAVPFDRDPLLGVQAAAQIDRAQRAFSTPELNFNGQPFTGASPPDTTGAVGMNYFIQAVNSGGGTSFVIYNKSNGSVAAGPLTLDSFGSGSCANGLGDPIVAYDEDADRWVLLEFSSFGDDLCIYVSQVSGNPITGGWYAYTISATNFPDYPKLAVWRDAYYLSSNENQPANYAINRTPMLSGAATTFQRITAPPLSGFGFQALIPADHDGDALPPSGAPNYFMRHRDDERHNTGSNNPTQDFVEIWEYSVDFNNPGNSSLSGPFNIAVSEFDSGLCGFTSFSCFDQPGGGSDLDPLREVIMYRLAYRNFGTHETLVGNFVTDVGADQGGIRWFELRKTGANWTLFQEGTYAPDSSDRWMAGIGVDQSGNIAMGYNVVSSSIFPSVRYTGRESTDPAGVMTQPEVNLDSGTSRSSTNRWGDYSTLTVDPVDDCTFWFTGEITTGSGSWDTQISSFRFDSCGEPPGGGNCGDGLLDAGESCDDANTANGDGCSSSCQVEAGFVCTDPIPPGQGGNVVADPSFEGGTPNASWAEASTNFGTPLCISGLCNTTGGQGPSDGAWWVWFGGIAAFEAGSVSQNVTIPTDATTLTFDVQAHTCNTAADFMQATIDGTQVYSINGASALCDAANYSGVSVNIGAFADGGTHTLAFTSEVFGAGGAVSNFLVDNIEIAGGGGAGTPSVCTPVGGGNIGATTTGMSNGFAACRNNATSQIVTIPGLGGNPTYDCTAAGLSASSGNTVLAFVRGSAFCGSPGGSCSVSEELSGIDGNTITCRNVTTGQTVSGSLGGGTTADCAAVGLSATQGNSVTILVNGTAQ